MSGARIVVCIAVMAGVTYLIRMIPLTAVRGRMKSPFVQRLLYFVPYAALSAMTVPAVFYSTGMLWSAVVGLAVAVLVSLFDRSLLTVAACACAGVFCTEFLLSVL